DDSLRLHVPRAVRLVYGVRNSRNAGHLKGGIDTSFQDATLVIGILDWMMAETVRVVHGLPRELAQGLVDGLVTKAVPMVSEYNGKPVLHADVSHVERLL